MLRVAGSLKLGWVTASLFIAKLQSFRRQNAASPFMNQIVTPPDPPRDDGAKTVGGAGNRALSLKIALPRRLIRIFPKGRIVWLMKMF